MLMDKNQYPAAETSFRIMTPMYKQDHNLSRFLEISYCEKNESCFSTAAKLL